MDRILSFLMWFFPVSKKIWAFNSYPDFTDNPYGFFYKTVSKRPDILFVWLVSDSSTVARVRSQVKEKNVLLKRLDNLI